jgi:tetraprenyl-beta-curcumene synthase
MPLSGAQRAALLRAAARELGGGLQAVDRELRRWRTQAVAIPDSLLREDALFAIDQKRGHTDGAALFWTLPTPRRIGLLRLLVTFEVIYDYLDNLSERAAGVEVAHARLFEALADALDPDGGDPGDYYRALPWAEDGGYLHALVVACRERCRELPGFQAVRPFLAVEAARFPVLALNHDREATRREAVLRRWAGAEFETDHGLEWHELTAAASQSVVTFALLALAADPHATTADAATMHAAYFPWFAYAVTMLDAYVDQHEDRRMGAHSYVGYYRSSERAVDRIVESVARSARSLLALPHGERHAVILGCMVGMYLSKDSASTPDLRDGTVRVRRAGGALTALLVPVLRLWRVANGQTAAT